MINARCSDCGYWRSVLLGSMVGDEGSFTCKDCTLARDYGIVAKSPKRGKDEN